VVTELTMGLRAKIDEAINTIKTACKDPEIVDFAEGLMGIGEHRILRGDYERETRRIFTWMKENIEYCPDPAFKDEFYYPTVTLKVGAGNCDDTTLLSSSLLCSLGYSTKLKLVSVGGKVFDHIYCLVGVPPKNPTEWWPIDVAGTDTFKTEPPYAFARVFDVATGKEEGVKVVTQIIPEKYILPALGILTLGILSYVIVK